MFLRFLLALPIVFIPNAIHFAGETSIAGLNFTNMMFLVLLVMVPLLAPEGAPRLSGHGRLSAALIFLFAAYILAFVLAQLLAPSDLKEDLTYLKTAIFYPLLYFMYRNCRLDLRATRQLIILVLVVAVVAGVEAIHEALDYGVLEAYTLTRRAAGPFGPDYRSANRAGVFYAMFFPMFVAMALFFRKQKLWRLAAISGCVILALAIMATYSRQAYAIALLCLLLVALRRSLVVACLIGVVMVGSVNMLPQSVTQRVQETEQTDTVGAEVLDTSTASRFDIWSGAMQMWRDHPAGVGLNRFQENIGNYSSFEGFDAHNFYILMLCEAGPLGLLAMLWLVWRLWALARALLHSAATLDAEAQALAAGFSLVVLATALGNVYGSPFLEGSVMANFWALCGLLERYFALKTASALAAPAVQPQGMADPSARFPLAARMFGRGDGQDIGRSG